MITHKPYTKFCSKHLQLACPLAVLPDNPLNCCLIFFFTYKFFRETLVIMVPIYLPYNFFSVHWNPNFTLSFSNNVSLSLLMTTYYRNVFGVLMRVRRRRKGRAGLPWSRVHACARLPRCYGLGTPHLTSFRNSQPGAGNAS